jgi:apolipoprotein N-acyltransferase
MVLDKHQGLFNEALANINSQGDSMDALSQLQTMGLTLPSPAYIVGAILFGLFGLGFYMVGKRRQKPRAKWLGVALMFYPYVVSLTWLLYLLGVALCGAAIWDLRRDA